MFQSFTRFVLIAALAVPAALAAVGPSPVPYAPTPVRRDVSADSFNPTDIVPKPIAQNAAAAIGAGLTNAQRLARGLPPRSPRLNTRRNRALAARQSATPCTFSQPTGIIRVSSANDNSLNGYISSTANSFGEYTVTTDASQALSVAIQRCNSASGPFDMTALNGALSSQYPYVGLVNGFASTDDNIRAGSYNYAYIAGTTIPAGSPAEAVPNAYSGATGSVKDAESAIWTLDDSDPNHIVLTPRWVNTDGSQATTQLVYSPGAGALAVVGDAAVFASNFGTATAVVRPTSVIEASEILSDAHGPFVDPHLRSYSSVERC
ncbi:hypothetical protein PYCCODRAFT_1371041 [Trametes coccinea BRFM310]|uniref:Uncharacterized protein n=1 Tax=Trametes coccinea (strain BRFM310) TaxID=1353009 RepID=A0A1Y2IHC6_TRAC3|nr:hypothetical protein PYCCODRAFT_1371041 [Trametes coccinea BRFM310]